MVSMSVTRARDGGEQEQQSTSNLLLVIGSPPNSAWGDLHSRNRLV